MKPWSVPYAGTRAGKWQPPLLAVLVLAATVTMGVAIGYSPVLAAGPLFIVLIAIARSRETAVALWLAVRVLMFPGYIPLPLGEVLLALITVVALARRIISGGTLRAPRLPVLWLLLLLLVTANLAYFGFVTESRNYAIEIFLENVLLLALIANTEPHWSRDGVQLGMAGILLGIGGVATLEWIVGRPIVLNAARAAYEPVAALHTFEGTDRPGSILLNPDWLAAAMVLGFVLWTGVALDGKGLRRWIAVLIAGFLLWVAYLTLSRAVFLGVPIGLGVLFAFAVRKGRASIGRLGIGVAALFVSAFGAFAVVPIAWLRITTDFGDPLRIGAYETAIRIIFAHPLEGLGAGWNQYLSLSEQYRVPAQYRPLAHPHNSFLELGAMLGLPVLLVVVLLIGRVLADALPSWKNPASSAVPFAGMVTMMVMSLTGNVITLPVLASLFWALWAVAGTTTPDSAEARPKGGAETARTITHRLGQLQPRHFG